MVFLFNMFNTKIEKIGITYNYVKIVIVLTILSKK